MFVFIYWAICAALVVILNMRLARNQASTWLLAIFSGPIGLWISVLMPPNLDGPLPPAQKKPYASPLSLVLAILVTATLCAIFAGIYLSSTPDASSGLEVRNYIDFMLKALGVAVSALARIVVVLVVLPLAIVFPPLMAIPLELLLQQRKAAASEP